MKQIVRIAKLELNTLFYSPVAWFLLIVFLFQCGMLYTQVIEIFFQNQVAGGAGLKMLNSLTSKTFISLRSFSLYSSIVDKLYFYLPLLTMGLMSREINSGTIKLLYSSPIRVREIIFGKFLAMMAYNLLLVGILAIFVVSAHFNIQLADNGLMVSGLIGIYLLLCAYAAIGLFMSCLTSYQIVAALSTLVLLAALNYVGEIWQGVDFIRDLTFFLSISGRVENMLSGLVTTRECLYFIVIIYIFLGFSIYKLQGDRESKSWPVKASRYVLIFVSALLIGYVASRPGFIGYWDATANKDRTLTVKSQGIMKEIGDEPLEVTSYINLFDRNFWAGTPSARNGDLSRWESYVRFKPGIKFNYVYFYDSSASYLATKKYFPGKTMKEMAEKDAHSYGLSLSRFKTPEEIRKVIDLRPEGNKYVMQLKYKGKTTFLRLYDDMGVFPSETETDAALKRLMLAKLPKIAFVDGELERSIDKVGDKYYKVLTNDFGFRNSLVNQGFDVEKLYLQTQDIPTDIAALVIADPKTDFDTAELAKIRRYIVSGGNLMIAGEPGRQSILNPVLQILGVHLMDGILIQGGNQYGPELVRPYLTSTAVDFYKLLDNDFEDSLPVSMPGAAALSYDTTGSFTVRPLLMTDGRSTWNKKKKLDLDMVETTADPFAAINAQLANVGSNAQMTEGGLSTGSVAAGVISAQKPAPEKKPGAFADLTFDSAQGDARGALPAAISLTRRINGKEQRIVVLGDADFLSNSELSRLNVRTSNFHFSTALFHWFSYGEFPVDTSRPRSKDNRFHLTEGALANLKILFLYILPGLLLLFGSVLLIRRKRK